MKNFRIFLNTILFTVVLSLSVVNSTWAITDGVPDCTDNATNAGCLYPNTVSISGFRLDTDTNEWVSSRRCSGSYLTSNNNRLIILTAGHCSSLYSQSLANGSIVTVGVSFDALIEKLPGSTSLWGSSQYILGGTPITYNRFGPTYNASNIQWDYGLIVFPLDNGKAITDSGTTVDLTAITPVTLPPLGFLETLQHNVDMLTNVGYGTGSLFNEKGHASPPDTPTDTNYDTFGVRYIADYSLFIGFQGQNQNLVLSSQNPARDNTGTCGGDSGGPQFVTSNDKELIVAITSSGDAVCRSTNIAARLDIPDAQNFINQCAYNTNTIDDASTCSLGCTEVDSKGICPK